MRAVVQRVSSASVTVAGEVVGRIDGGLLVLLGVAHGDADEDATALASKLVGLRIFADDEGRMNRSVADIGGAVLVVSQFTLLASVAKGRRPSFTGAAEPDAAERLVEVFVKHVADSGVPVAGGRFGAHMLVELCNDGPVTLVLDASAGRVV